MIITKDWLITHNACTEAIEEFCSQSVTASIRLLRLLISKGKKHKKYTEWAAWLIVRLMTGEECVLYAVYAAELVLPIFQKRFPTDDRPRKAIKMAKECIDTGTVEAADAATEAARAAARAATEAADAARATWAAWATWAAGAAEAAARAAEAAARAAGATGAAGAAGAAAGAAEAAQIKTYHKLLKYGLKLLTTRKRKEDNNNV